MFLCTECLLFVHSMNNHFWEIKLREKNNIEPPAPAISFNSQCLLWMTWAMMESDQDVSVLLSSMVLHWTFRKQALDWYSSIKLMWYTPLVEVNQALYAWSFRQGINDSPIELNLKGSKEPFWLKWPWTFIGSPNLFIQGVIVFQKSTNQFYLVVLLWTLRK